MNRYFVSHEESIIYQGNTYQPLPMFWGETSVSQAMNLPTVDVAVPNIDGQVADYLQHVDLSGRDVTLLLLHSHLLGDSAVHQLKFQVLIATLENIGGDDEMAHFMLGINTGLDDFLPRHVITRTEFPGVPDDVRRASVLGI